MPSLRSGQQVRILVLSVALISLSAIILYVETITHHEFLLHVAAIPLELLVGAILFERFIASRERKRNLKQLSYIKGYLFRFDMRKIFSTNFESICQPSITMNQIHRASVEELEAMRRSFADADVTHASPEAFEAVLENYIESQRVFEYFMEWAIQNDFQKIFTDMIFVLNFIQDIKVLRDLHPGQSLASQVSSRPDLHRRANKISKDNVLSFLDYAIELRKQRPHEFFELLDDYQTPKVAEAA